MKIKHVKLKVSKKEYKVFLNFFKCSFKRNNFKLFRKNI